MPSKAIERLLRACDMALDALDAHRITQGRMELREAAAAVRAELAREPVELSDEELMRSAGSFNCHHWPDLHAVPSDCGECCLAMLRRVARAARGEKP